MPTNDQNPASVNEAAAAATAPAAKKKSRVLLLIALAVALAGAGAGWFLFGRKSVAAKNTDPKPVTVLHLDPFIVNLADTDRDAYLRVGIDLGVTGLPNPKKGDEEKAAAPVAEIRDAILSVLSTYHSSELLSPAGKKQLKDSLMAALNRRLPQLGVRDVFFTDFLVQR